MELIKRGDVEAVKVRAEAIEEIARWLSPAKPGYYQYGDGPFEFRAAAPHEQVVAMQDQWIVKRGATLRVMSDDALKRLTTTF